MICSVPSRCRWVIATFSCDTNVGSRVVRCFGFCEAFNKRFTLVVRVVYLLNFTQNDFLSGLKPKKQLLPIPNRIRRQKSHTSEVNFLSQFDFDLMNLE
jgi:hypothetical protein